MCGAELTALPEGVQKVAAFLLEAGHSHPPVMLTDAARTAQQAADALGVALGQIAKSIVFRRKFDDAAVLVVTAGDRRVDESKLDALGWVCQDGRRLGRADAAFVKDKTGFSIGGVSPVAHSAPLVTVIDASLLRFDVIWAAAGHPHAVFQLSPHDLQRLTGAPVIDVAVDPARESAGLQSAIELVSARALTILSSGVMASPCISVCRMTRLKGLADEVCGGCFRTLDELLAWGSAGDDAKRAVWQHIEQRMELLKAP
ncbi:MAG: DUF1289 domain-containing protein [Polaromonas sp.]|nr:DUF1289 domain-containing protein [Polaromonas sp.]